MFSNPFGSQFVSALGNSDGSVAYQDGPVFPQGGTAAPAPWDPLTISSGTVILWLDPQQGVTMNGSNQVSLWEDQSPSGIDFAQSTDANKYVYDATAINGVPGLVSTGTRSMSSSGTFSATAGRYFFLVLKNDTDPSAGVNAAYVFDSVNFGSLIPYLNGVVYDAFGRNAGQTVGDLTDDLATAFVYTVYTNTSVFTVWINGVQVYTTGSPAGALAWPATLYLGGNGFGSFLGKYGDAIVVDSGAGALSGTDFDYILNGLKDKYAIA